MTHPASGLLREWFNRGQSGCKFASQLASRATQLAFHVHLGPPAQLDFDDIDSSIDDAATRKDVCLLVFPRICSDQEIVELVLRLQRGSRWTVEPRAAPQSPDGQPNFPIAGVNIEFQTAQRVRSSAMGFAPSGCMPVTRRAPFAALALWGGENANPFFSHSPAGTVNMADVPTALNRESYDNTWTSSVADTQRRLTDPPYESAWLRRVAYCLPRALVEAHWSASSTSLRPDWS